jgi:putative addiction module component (TIGR02574 family)
MTATEVLEQFRALPPAEQRLVAEQIWEAYEPEFETPELIAELERRAAEFRKNPAQGVPWEQIRAELRQKFGWS